MKKIFVLAIIALATVSNSFALDLNEYKVFYKLNNEKTFTSLSRYLGTSSAQEEQLKYVFTETERKMKSAVGSENDAAAEKALWFNLGNAKHILTADQYKKYLATINLSIYVNSSEFYAEK